MCPITASTGRSANVGTVLAHRLRRWPNTVPTLAEGHLLAGISLTHTVFCRCVHLLSLSMSSESNGD